jgi:hypothetical protein
MKQEQRPTCKYGHVWEATTSDTLRRCRGSRCQAIQRLERGQWVTIEGVAVSRSKRQESVSQVALF